MSSQKSYYNLNICIVMNEVLLITEVLSVLLLYSWIFGICSPCSWSLKYQAYILNFADRNRHWLSQDYYTPNQLFAERVFIATDDCIPRVVNRQFKDEDGNFIKNKFGYFKNAIISNINRLNIDIDDLWSDDHLLDLYDSITNKEKNDDFER